MSKLLFLILLTTIATTLAEYHPDIIAFCLESYEETLEVNFAKYNCTGDEQIYLKAHYLKKCADLPNLGDIDVPNYEEIIRVCGSDLECIKRYLKLQEWISASI